MLGWVRDSFGQGRAFSEEFLEALVDRVGSRVHSGVLQAAATTETAAGPDDPMDPSSSDGEGPSPNLQGSGHIKEVANEHRKKRHLVLIGPPCVHVGQWLTRCG